MPDQYDHDWGGMEGFIFLAFLAVLFWAALLYLFPVFSLVVLGICVATPLVIALIGCLARAARSLVAFAIRTLALKHDHGRAKQPSAERS